MALSRSVLLPVFVVTFLFSGTLLAAPKSVTGEVTHVTLYRGQAMVTRTIPLEGARGSHELVVTGLPGNVLAGSLFAEGGENVEVRAVRFHTRAVGEEPREEVRRLDAAIEEVDDKLALNAKKQKLVTQRGAYLDKLEGFVAPTAKTELSKGVLDAESFEKITLFSFEQRQALVTEQTELEKEAKQLKKELSLFQRQRAEVASGSSRTVREALLFVEKSVDGAESLRLNYLVNGCGWSPSYVFRAGEASKKVDVEYNALVHQMTGEDWKNVALTLSTASPALSAAGPGLAPFHVSLLQSSPGQKQNAKSQDLAGQLRSIQSRQSSAIVQNRQAMNLVDNFGSSWDVNAAANDFQCLELVGGEEILSKMQMREDEGPSLSYRLDGRVSLASRSDQQMVRILQNTFPSRSYHVATPILSSYVYREAELTNSSSEDLLAGPMTVYLDGRFVGRGEISTVARGQTFVVGFGADPQLRTRRELAGKKEGVQGGNRELDVQYRLVIENFKAAAVDVRVLDRLPYSNSRGDIRVTVAAGDDALSEDKLYQRRERSKGILRWDISVAGGATGEKARIIYYGFKVEFDRKYQLAAVGPNRQLQQEFEDLHLYKLAH